MKLNLSKITPEGFRRTLRYQAEELARLQSEFEVTGGWVSGEVEIIWRGESVVVSGLAKARIELPCGVCLGETKWEGEEKFTAVYLPVSQLNEEPVEVMLTSVELDIDFLTTEFLDLREMVEEQVLLMLPTVVKCTEECKGLCAGCGASLNQEPCTCKVELSDHPFAGLAELLAGGEKEALRQTKQQTKKKR